MRFSMLKRSRRPSWESYPPAKEALWPCNIINTLLLSKFFMLLKTLIDDSRRRQLAGFLFYYPFQDRRGLEPSTA